MFSPAVLDTIAPHVFAGREPDDAPRAPHTRSANVGFVSGSGVRMYDGYAERIRTGDADAFAEVVKAHYNGLVRFAASMLRVADDAEDLVQDVLTRLWNGRARIDPQRALHTYLFTAVRNGALNWVRDEHVRERRAAVFETGGDNSAVPSPADEFDVRVATANDAARLRALSDALQALPERRRTAMLLRFERGMTHGEIGAVLGVSEKAAQQIVLRTIAELRTLLLPRTV